MTLSLESEVLCFSIIHETRFTSFTDTLRVTLQVTRVCVYTAVEVHFESKPLPTVPEDAPEVNIAALQDRALTLRVGRKLERGATAVVCANPACVCACLILPMLRFHYLHVPRGVALTLPLTMVSLFC